MQKSCPKAGLLAKMDKDASAEALGWTLCAVLGLSYGLVAGVAGCRALNLRGRGTGAVDDAEGPPPVGDALRGGAVRLLRPRVDAVGLGGGDRVGVRDAGAAARVLVWTSCPPRCSSRSTRRGVILGEMVFVATDGALLYGRAARRAVVTRRPTLCSLCSGPPWPARLRLLCTRLCINQNFTAPFRDACSIAWWRRFLAARLMEFICAQAPGPYALVSALYAFAAALSSARARRGVRAAARAHRAVLRHRLREIGALTSAGAFATLGRSVALLAGVRPCRWRARGTRWCAGYLGCSSSRPCSSCALLPPDPAAAPAGRHAALFPLKARAATRGRRAWQGPVRASGAARIAAA